jgi:hypothetical protein
VTSQSRPRAHPPHLRASDRWPMKRRLFHLLWGTSLLLALTACLMWWRSLTTDEDYYLATRGGVLWNMGSGRSSLGFTRVGHWQGSPAYWRAKVVIGQESALEEGAFPLLISGGVGGASVRRHACGSLVVASGRVCSPADAVGNVKLCPPFPPGNMLTWNVTRPMPYLGLQVPYWLLAVCLSMPALGAVASRVPGGFRIGTQYLRLLRHENRRCIYCGYDLRSSPDRCPECGSPKAVVADFKRLELTRRVIRRLARLISFSMFLLLVALVCAAASLKSITDLVSDAWWGRHHWREYGNWSLLVDDLTAIVRLTTASFLLFWLRRQIAAARRRAAAKAE